MKKIDRLRKKLLVEGSIAGGIVAAALVAMTLASSWMQTAETARRQAQAKLQNLQTETQKAQTRLESAGASMALYDALKKERDDVSLVIGRQELTRLLAQMKETYRLSSLNLQMDPEQPYEDEETRGLNIKVVKTSVKLEFGGMSDRHLLSFVQDLRRKLPGFVTVGELTLTRDKLFDIEAMRQISQGATPQMVSGSLAFDWYGYPQTTTQPVLTP